MPFHPRQLKLINLQPTPMHAGVVSLVMSSSHEPKWSFSSTAPYPDMLLFVLVVQLRGHPSVKKEIKTASHFYLLRNSFMMDWRTFDAA